MDSIKQKPASGMPTASAHVNHGETILTVGADSSFVYTIRDAVGLHAHPAGALVKLVKQYKSEITLSAGGKTAPGDSIMRLMALGVTCGTTVTVEAHGEDAEQALAALRDFFTANL